MILFTKLNDVSASSAVVTPSGQLEVRLHMQVLNRMEDFQKHSVGSLGLSRVHVDFHNIGFYGKKKCVLFTSHKFDQSVVLRWILDFQKCLCIIAEMGRNECISANMMLIVLKLAVSVLWKNAYKHV